MKYKKFLVYFVLCFVLILSGCGRNSVAIDNRDFVKYNIESNMPKTAYKICKATELVTMYFPVVTNKKITSTKLGGVAAKLPSAKGNIKVTLNSMLQDKVNYSCQDKYISFLKYEVDIKNEELLQANDIITLCDTMLWIYHYSEFQQIQIDEEYLQITIVDNEDEKFLPDWNRIIAILCENIEHRIKSEA